MDDQGDERRAERREQLPRHETRPEETVGGGMVGSAGTAEDEGRPDADRLAALPAHERPGPAGEVSRDYSEMTTGDRDELETDRSDTDEMPPVNRSG